MSLNNRNKGSVQFVFYFIAGLTLLAVAGYYIGLNEQSKLFKSVTDRKQQQENYALNGKSDEQSIIPPSVDSIQEAPVKSLIDSPLTVLRNLNRSGDDVAESVNVSSPKETVLSSTNINARTIFNIAKQLNYQIKNNLNVKLINGEASGESCYTQDVKRICFPIYKLDNIIAVGDLNGDKIDDAVVVLSVTDSLLPKEVKSNRFYALIASPLATSSATTSNIVISSSTVSYNSVLFNYGSYIPVVLSAEITNGVLSFIGNFYANNDVVGIPTINKVVKYKINSELIASSTSYSIKKLSEARLFKEQWESVVNWYQYDYLFSGLDFSFKAPEAWQRIEHLGDNLSVSFTDTDNRNIILNTASITETCSEYGFNISVNKNIKIRDSEFIDLGSFGVGYYVKYTKNIDSENNAYYADICVSDKNNDRKVFSLSSTTKEDGDPYFVIYDKIWSTFKVSQND